MERKPQNFRQKPLFILFLLVILSTLSQGQDVKKGIWYLKQDQFISAKKTFLGIVTKDTSNAQAFYYLGQIYFMQNKVDSAEYCYQRGLRSNPKMALNYVGVGKILLGKGNRPEWVKYYDKGRKVASDLYEYNLEAADACLSVQNPYNDLVSLYLDAAKEEQSKKPGLYIGYGNFYLKTKSPGEAVNEYERAVFYDKTCVEAYLKLGSIYQKANNFRDGLTAYNNGINADTSQILGYKLRGDLYYNFAKYEEAMRDYDVYIPRSDKTIEDLQKYAFILFFARDFERATTLINTLLQEDPKLSILYRIQAYIDYETGKFPEGLKDIETFFQNHDTTKFIALDFMYYGRLLIKNNQDSVGTIELIKAVELDSTKVEVYEDLAKSYAKMKKFQESIDAYNKMLIVNPVNTQNIYYQIGRNYYFMAEDTVTVMDSLQRAALYIKADSSFLKVTELSPESYIGFIWRGRTHSRMDPETTQGLSKPDYEAAMAILEKGDPTKTPKLLIECYRYLAFYYYVQSDLTAKTDPAGSKQDIISSIDYWNKVLTLDPNDGQAKTALENLKVQ
jgi:tetratricopeptide (TPR) repeat protein